jgi:uncharacterized membrane-anchored protein YjiN (DUF445 family)
VRRLASGLLLAMACLYLLARHYAPQYPALHWLRAFAEAAMVGGLADWFAVTALFRHPLGLPIPHTAIIPENKDRIAGAMAGFLRANFLTPQVVARRLAGLDVAGALGGFLAILPPRSPGCARHRRADGRHAAIAARRATGQPAERHAAGATGTAGCGPLLGQLLEASIADGRHRPVIEAMLRWTGEALEANEELLRQMIHDRAHALVRWTGLDETLANTILDGLYRLLAECVVDPNHPCAPSWKRCWRGWRKICAMMRRCRRVARMKAEVLANRRWAPGSTRCGTALAPRCCVRRAIRARCWMGGWAPRWRVWAGPCKPTRACATRSTVLRAVRWQGWRCGMAMASSRWCRIR